jgi:glycosyltransferase involved in cell wall biosynthesis
MADGVSVIICCYNSVSRLPETLKHLAAQQTRGLKAEVILVDNASTDGTRHIALSLWSAQSRHDIPLVVVEEPLAGLSRARARGIAHAAYDVLVFCDDDNWLEPGYLQHAFSILEANPAIGALGGVGLPVADAPLPAWFEQYKGCFACYPQGECTGELTGPSAFLYGAGLVVRKSVLTALIQRGFNAILSDRVGKQLSSGGDVELCYAVRLAGYKLWYSSDLVFRHYMPGNRLTQQYLCRLMAASSYCGSQLIVYLYALKGHPADFRAWVKDSVYQVVFLMRTLLKDAFRPSSRLEKKLNLLFSWNRTKAILGMWNAYSPLYKQIVKLKGECPVDKSLNIK